MYILLIHAVFRNSVEFLGRAIGPKYRMSQEVYRAREGFELVGHMSERYKTVRALERKIITFLLGREVSFMKIIQCRVPNIGSLLLLTQVL
jgi:hypothetical protein